MRRDLGSHVRCSDDARGRVADIMVDPTTRRR
jgi:hypothetical protein